MNNFIQNVSRFDIITGRHADAGENSMLIQIVDFFDTFPAEQELANQAGTLLSRMANTEELEFLMRDAKWQALFKDKT